MLDFGQPAGEAFAAAFNELIDAAVKAERDAQPPRDYLGGSRLGEECQRRLGYEWHRAPADPDKGFSGRTYRIFERGHDCEARVAKYLRAAGFDLLTEKADGGQFGFSTAQDRETSKGRIRGHLDGVIVSGPSRIGPVEMRYPCLWENKGVGKKAYTKYTKDGIKKGNPIYYAQMQVYMGMMDLEWALFTAECQDDCLIYPELLPFVAADAQAALDRGLGVVLSQNPEELPRVAADPTDFRCKWCDYALRCHAAAPQDIAPAIAKPAWLGTR